MNKSERKERRRRKALRKDSYIAVGIFAYVCSLIFRIPLINIIGENGIAYFSVANEIYVAVGCIFTYGLSMAVSALVRFRVKREQFKNADRVLRGALILAVFIGVILSITFIFSSTLFAKNVVKLPLAGLAISVMAPAIVFQMMTGAFRGYFEGNGSHVPTIHSVLIETMIMIIGGSIGAIVLYKYGIKVSALLQNENYAFAYGAMGASIGIFAASFLGFLHMLLLFFIFHGNAKRQTVREFQKSQDSGLRIIRILIGTAVPFTGYAVLLRILPFLDGIFFIRMAGGNIDASLLWGNYYGKYWVVIGIICLFITLIGAPQTKIIIYFVDREEMRLAREKTSLLVHQMALVSIPAAIFTAVLSENLLNLLFKGNNESTAVLVTLGSVLIVLVVFSNLFGEILLRLKRIKHVIGYEAIAFLTHIMLVWLLLGNTGLSIKALVIANIISYSIMMVIGFLLVGRSLQYRQEWLHTAAFTIVAASIAGLIMMLLNRVLAPHMGTTISLIICLPVAIIIYIVLLIVTKAVTQKELENMPGGGILLQLGRIIKLR